MYRSLPLAYTSQYPGDTKTQTHPNQQDIPKQTDTQASTLFVQLHVLHLCLWVQEEVLLDIVINNGVPRVHPGSVAHYEKSLV